MIRKYLLQCYRLDAANIAVATEERKGKYAGAVEELDGRQVPHGVGTFKTSHGFASQEDQWVVDCKSKA